jgi:predicted site-specific integrase-resolvase
LTRSPRTIPGTRDEIGQKLAFRSGIADIRENQAHENREQGASNIYLRTSSAANVGQDKDSEQRQRAAITGFAKPNGYDIAAEFYDAAVSGADPVTERPGFIAMLERIAGNGVRVILVESPDRFARDLCSSPATTC